MQENDNSPQPRGPGRGRGRGRRRGRGRGKGRGRGNLSTPLQPLQPLQHQPIQPRPVYDAAVASQAQSLDPALTPSYDPAWYVSTQQHGTAGQVSGGGESSDWHRRYSSAANSSQTVSNSPSNPNSGSLADPRIYRRNPNSSSPHLPGAVITNNTTFTTPSVRPSTPPILFAYADSSQAEQPNLDWSQKYASPSVPRLPVAARIEPIIQDHSRPPNPPRSPSPSSKTPPILTGRNQKRGPYFVENARRDSE
jgi:hypothetical protein